jgi:hypothetical protein
LIYGATSVKGEHMAESTGTTALTGTSAEDQAILNDLLGDGAGGGEEETVTETEQKPGTHTETEETKPAKVEEDKPTETEEATDEEVETETEEDEPEEEETELSIEDSDRDYSQEAYEKAAAFYSKKLKVQFDPNDAKDRVTLSRLLKDREALAAQKSELEAKAEKAKTDEVKPADEAKPAEAVKFTPEQIEAGLQEIENVAKSRTVPEVAMRVASNVQRALIKMLWPKGSYNEETEKWEPIKPDALSQEAASEFTTALHAMFLMALDDAAEPLYGMVNGKLASDPVWGPARSEAIDARAFEHLDKTKGAEWYASMETLVDNGTIKKVISENPEIFRNIRAGDGKDPVKNRAAQLEAAYKIARGDQTIQQVTKAVETGKKKATDLAKKVAAGRVSAGTPKSGFKPAAGSGTELVRNITQGGGSKFSAAIKSQLHK